MKKLVLLFFVVSSTITLAQESVLLRLKYQKGDVYQAKMTMSQNMGTVMSMGMNIDMDINITDVTGDLYTSEMKFAKMTMDMLQGGNVMSFDSSKSDDELDEAGKMMKNQVGPMLTSVIFAKGNNLGEMLEVKVEPNVPGMDDFANQSSTVVYPKESLKVGSTWTITKEQKGVVLNFVYKVKSILKDKVILDITGKTSGMATGDITGSIDVDRESGIPINSLIDMVLSVQGQEMKSKVTMTMVKK